MGPRSDNRGYVGYRAASDAVAMSLQWVHGRITVVMKFCRSCQSSVILLQWVHGRITVVMLGVVRFEMTGV